MKRIFGLILALLLILMTAASAEKEFTVDENNWLRADLDNNGTAETVDIYCMPFTENGGVPVILSVMNKDNETILSEELVEFMTQPEGSALTIDLYLPEKGLLAVMTFAGAELPVTRWVYVDVKDDKTAQVSALEDPGYTLGVGLLSYTALSEEDYTTVYEADEYDEVTYTAALNAFFAGAGLTFAANGTPAGLEKAKTFTEADLEIFEGDEDISVNNLYVYAESNVKIRKGPGIENDELSAMMKGAIAEYLYETECDSRDVEWYKIKYNGNEGWVSSKYAYLLEDDSTEVQGGGESALDGCTEAAVTAQSINVRKQPYLTAEKLGILYQGDVVELIGGTSVDERGVAWYQVKFDGDEGWISSKYVKLQ